VKINDSNVFSSVSLRFLYVIQKFQ